MLLDHPMSQNIDLNKIERIFNPKERVSIDNVELFLNNFIKTFCHTFWILKQGRPPPDTVGGRTLWSRREALETTLYSSWTMDFMQCQQFAPFLPLSIWTLCSATDLSTFYPLVYGLYVVPPICPLLHPSISDFTATKLRQSRVVSLASLARPKKLYLLNKQLKRKPTVEM